MSDPREFRPGRRLGPYEIVAPLGAGGMGEVFRARDPRLDREVALKILPLDVARDAGRLARFEQEARALAALNHPNIVTIHSVEEADGVRFLTMELVEGRTLTGLIRPGGLDLDRFLGIAVALADALAAAHARGVLHRDLKPANVMVTTEGRVKVLDFGLAKVTQAALGDATAAPTRTLEELTREGQLVGTVPYMSPEQIEGRGADARSDIFSLGTVLYELATGARPFAGESSAALLSSILRDEPSPVSELRPELPRQLGRILRRCLAKDPERRVQSAKDLRNELEELREEVGESGGAAVSSPPLGRRLRRTLLGLIALVALLAAVWLLGDPREDSPPTEETLAAEEIRERLLVVLPFENLGRAEDEYFAEGISDEIGGRLARLAGLGVIARTSAMRYKGSDKDVQAIGEELGVDYVLEGTVRWEHGADGSSRVRVTPQLVRAPDAVRLWGEVYEEELAGVFRIQAEIAERVASALELALFEADHRALHAEPTQDLEAYGFYLRGNQYLFRDEREEDFVLAQGMYERAIDRDPGFALAHAMLSRAHTRMYWWHYDRSAERLEQARAAVDRALELDPGLPEGRLSLGFYYYHGRLDYERALEELEAAREMAPDDPQIIEAMGWVQRRQGRWQDAIRNLERALRLDPRSVTLNRWTGQTHFYVRSYDRAEVLTRRSVELAPDVAWSYLWLARISVARDEDTRCAREWLEKGLAAVSDETPHYFVRELIELDLLDRDFEGLPGRAEQAPWEVLESQWEFEPRALWLAGIETVLGRPERARARFEEARKLLEEALAAHPEDPRVYSALGVAHAGLGRREEAVRLGLRAVELLPIEREAMRGAYRQEDLARIYTLLGEPEAAIAALEPLLRNPSHLFVALLRLDPRWDPLREHPEFQKLLVDPGGATRGAAARRPSLSPNRTTP